MRQSLNPGNYPHFDEVKNDSMIMLTLHKSQPLVTEEDNPAVVTVASEKTN